MLRNQRKESEKYYSTQGDRVAVGGSIVTISLANGLVTNHTLPTHPTPRNKADSHHLFFYSTRLSQRKGIVSWQFYSVKFSRPPQFLSPSLLLPSACLKIGSSSPSSDTLQAVVAAYRSRLQTTNLALAYTLLHQGNVNQV